MFTPNDETCKAFQKSLLWLNYQYIYTGIYICIQNVAKKKLLLESSQVKEWKKLKWK